MIQTIDNSRDIKCDSEEGHCCVPISLFPNDEYKYLVANEFHKINIKILLHVFDKMMELFDQEVEKAPSVVLLVAKQFRFLFLSGVEISRDQAKMMRDAEPFEQTRKVSMLRRIGIILKWAYLPCDILDLKFYENVKTKNC